MCNENDSATLMFLASHKIKPYVKDIYCVVKLMHYSQKCLPQLKPHLKFHFLKLVQSIDAEYMIWPLKSITNVGIHIKFDKDEFVVFVPKSLEKD